MSLDVNLSEPDEFNCTELHSVIKDVAKIKGISEFKYHVDSIGGKGESYIANTFRVIITNSDNEDNTVTVIVKTLVNTARREMFHELHKREVSVYKEIIPVFNKIQAEHLDRKVVLPQYVLSCDDKGKEVLILDDLQHGGWMSDVTLKKFEELDYNKVKLVVTELARFHALSFAFERQNPLIISELKEKFQDIIFNDKFLNKTKLRSYFQDSFDASLKLLINNDALKSLTLIRSKLLEVLRDFTKPWNHNVFCHGDCWINNMLFKFQGSKATDVCFLDFQAMRYANPVTDIIYFLYLCTSPQFRSEYFETLKSDYHDTLKSTLSLFSIDVDSVYPMEEFINDLDAAKQYGLLIAMVELKIVYFISEDEVLNEAQVHHEPVANVEPVDEKLLKIKLNDVVQEAIENGALEKLYERVKNWHST